MWLSYCYIVIIQTPINPNLAFETMSELNYSISPATITDLPTLARLLCHSKLTLTITRLLQEDSGNEDLLLARCTRAVEDSLNDPAAETLKVVDGITGNIIGHMTTTMRKKSTSQSERIDTGKKAANAQGLNPDVSKAVFKAIAELSEVRDAEHLGENSHVRVQAPWLMMTQN